MNKNLTCRGSYLLGTACGKCIKCEEEFKRLKDNGRLSEIRPSNVAKPDACPQLCDVTALREYIRSCIDNFSRHNKDHPEDTTNSAFQFAFEGIMRKIDELCKD